jgi:hypothetical protein
VAVLRNVVQTLNFTLMGRPASGRGAAHRRLAPCWRDQDTLDCAHVRSEVGRWNAVFRCCLVGRSDPEQRRLGKRPADEHDPHWKLCRNGPDQTRTAGSRGFADSIIDVSGETRRDGQCWKAVLAQQAPDRTGAWCRGGN